MTAELRSTAGDVELVVLPDVGGKIASLRVAGRELLAAPGGRDAPRTGGSFLMVPWAGRIRRGRFTFDGVEHRVPVNLGAHAIHGTVLDRPWEVIDDSTLRCELDDRWPFAGHVIARWELAPDRLHQSLEVHAAEPMPVAVGWHPWFRRRLDDGRPVELVWRPGFVFERDDEGIPTGRTVAVPAGPWDDCFGGLAGPPLLRWPGALELEVDSDCPCVVVFDEPADTLCVEPQSAPPDAVNLVGPARAPVVEPGEPFVRTTTWTWRPLTD
ncbi:MAG: aldose 1-epimerase [Actinomycetota bacterium]